MHGEEANVCNLNLAEYMATFSNIKVLRFKKRKFRISFDVTESKAFEGEKRFLTMDLEKWNYISFLEKIFKARNRKFWDLKPCEPFRGNNLSYITLFEIAKDGTRTPTKFKLCDPNDITELKRFYKDIDLLFKH